MDAILKQYLDHAGDQTMLEMEVVLTIKNDKLVVAITDNASGFSDAYLTYFEESIKSKSYKFDTTPSEKQQNADLYFGGASRGIPILCNLLLDGETLDNPGVSSQRYKMTKKDETSIKIENKKGAKIIMSSPLIPFVPFEERPMRKREHAELADGSDFFMNIGESNLMARRLFFKRSKLDAPYLVMGITSPEKVPALCSSLLPSPPGDSLRNFAYLPPPLSDEDSNLHCNTSI